MSASSVVALCGGVGGAKLALGLYRVLPPDRLTLIVNTGDDFDHLGLRICPDLDTTLYTLADLANPEAGWGRRDETWTFMKTLADLGGETWFRLGDADLALHVERTRRLQAGEPLSRIVADVARRFRIHAAIVPMSDEAVRTRVHTREGVLAFQEYFVRRRCEPAVTALEYAGAAAARIAPQALAALNAAEVAAIILCPSNPYLSVDPILALPGMRAALKAAPAPVIAVTPLVAGKAIKGPTAKIMAELEVPLSSVAIAGHYADFIDGFVLDRADAALVPAFRCSLLVADTLMVTLADRERLAREVLQFAATLRRQAEDQP
ncbi:MAG TPA: 2-phospho-L-lactate transferase [Steroidobacteraceae bacterium]|nr:2-phospho-L-lactate transferase [Steroidobacteraceae bacterium]